MGTTLDLTDDETATLLRELDNIIANDRYVRRLLSPASEASTNSCPTGGASGASASAERMTAGSSSCRTSTRSAASIAYDIDNA